MRCTWITSIFLTFVLVLIAAPAQTAPNEAIKRNNFGSELVKQGKLDEAIVEFRQAVELDPRYAMAQLNLAYTYDRLGRTDEAIAAYKRGLDLDPKNTTAWNNLGVLYSQNGLNDEAIKAFEQGLMIDASDPKLQQNLASAKNNKEVLQERETKVAEAMKKATARPKDPRAAYDVARLSAFYGQNDQALEWLGKAMQLGFDDPEAAKVDPVFVGLKKDPRFSRILAKQ